MLARWLDTTGIPFLLKGDGGEKGGGQGHFNVIHPTLSKLNMLKGKQVQDSWFQVERENYSDN